MRIDFRNLKVFMIRISPKIYFNEISRKSIVFLFGLGLCACFSKQPPLPELRFLVDSAPATLNPRQTLDAIGQRIEMLTFRALTSLDVELNPVSDLSEKWRFEAAGHRVVFKIKQGQMDHLGRPISASHIYECLQNYLFREPTSPHRSSFPYLKSISFQKENLIFHLSAVDPYLPKNLSVLRYFATRERPDHPCADPKPGEIIITNGDYETRPYPEHFEQEMRFHPRKVGYPVLVVQFIRDETSRMLKLMNGEANTVMNGFSPTKTNWITSDPGKGFKLIEREGTNASYLAFNLRDPILGKKSVRLAIAHAIDRAAIVKYRLKGQAALASSFLNSNLAEGMPFRGLSFDPQLSEKLLDEAGFQRGLHGVRFSLRYKTTTDRLGLELAQVYQDMLRKIGIELDLETMEPSVFFSSIRKGNFQMYMSRWIGVSDGSIYERTLRTGKRGNLLGYSDATVDAWIDQTGRELDPVTRRALLLQIQERMLEDLPYFPLWHWTNALIIQNTLTGVQSKDLSLSGSFISLKKLRFE